METRSFRLKFESATFRQVLQEELVNRCRNNPNYSLRSFARALHVEPSTLSQIINGKRPITEKMKLKLGAALGIPTSLLEKIAISPRSESKMPIPAYQQMTLDTFALISDWYHYAILELLSTEGFKPDPTWIGRRLGITKSEANIAIERLFRLELLQKQPDGSWADTAKDGTTSHLKPGVTSDAARKYQCQLLELSKRAVQEVDLSKRNHTSATFCFDPEDLPQAIARITEFRRQFANEFQPKKKGQEVYQIQISLFPLTKTIEKKEVTQ